MIFAQTGIEGSLIGALASLGVSGVLAAVILFMYCRFRDQTERETNRREDRMATLLEAEMETRERNTKALTELTTLVQRLNGKH